MKIRASFHRLPFRTAIGSSLLALAIASACVPPAVAQMAALRLNDRGEAVSEVQQRLLELGYYKGEITGFYGPMTQEAVTLFQKETGLAADGIVGAATESALRQGGNSAGTAPASPQDLVRFGDSGPQIAELQRRLAELGYFKGTVSSTFDRPTEESVVQFQRESGIPADGIVGPATAMALRQPAPSSPSVSQPAGQPAAPSASNPSAQPGSRPAGVLRLGDTGTAVSELQGRLSEQGFYRGAVTGSYDVQTQAAVLALQQSKGLIADGIAGPQVNAALGLSVSSASPGAAPGSDQSWRQLQQMQAEAQQARTEAEKARQEAEQARLEAEQARLTLNQNLEEGRYSVAELQRSLQSQGYSPGTISGVLTPETRNAIVEAQRRHGLNEADLFGNGLP